MREALRFTGVPGVVQGIGARFGLYLGLAEPPTNFREVLARIVGADRNAT